MQIQYSAAGFGGNETADTVADVIFQFIQKIAQRRAERRNLRTMHARLRAVSAHTLRDIGIDRDELISIDRPASTGNRFNTNQRGQANGGD